MKNIYTLLALCFLFTTYAQEEKQKDIYKNKGYFNITKITYYKVNKASLELPNNFVGQDVKGSSANGKSLQTINGYFITPKLSAGIGIGLESFENPRENTFPVFLDLRYYFDNNYSSLYIFGNIGGTLKLGDDFRKGGLLNGGIGYKFFVNSNKTTAFVADLGYFHRYLDVPIVNSSDANLLLNGPSISLGMIF